MGARLSWRVWLSPQEVRQDYFEASEFPKTECQSDQSLTFSPHRTVPQQSIQLVSEVHPSMHTPFNTSLNLQVAFSFTACGLPTLFQHYEVGRAKGCCPRSARARANHSGSRKPWQEHAGDTCVQVPECQGLQKSLSLTGIGASPASVRPRRRCFRSNTSTSFSAAHSCNPSMHALCEYITG